MTTLDSFFFFFSSRRRHTRLQGDWSSDVCSSDLRAQLEGVLRDYLGATNVLWLGDGIAGDDTHGHVDDLCRFVNPRTVVLCSERDPREANYRALRENRERLEGMRPERSEERRVGEEGRSRGGPDH